MLSKKVRIPHDVVIEILSRLPAESLMRFKCVHKSWYVLVEDSKFISLQLRNHVWRNNDCFRILILTGEEGRFTRVEYVPPGESEIKDMISIARYDGEAVSFFGKDAVLTTTDMRNSISYVSGHCDGIVCFYSYCDYAVISNPGIGQFRTLPKSCIPDPYCNSDPEQTYERQTIALGLGSDLRTNDYKVVRILEISTSRGTPVSNAFEVEVYSLSSNFWRQIEALPQCIYGFLVGYTSSYWNGAYYWPGAKTTTLDPYFSLNGILSFNFSDEVFEFISIPEDVSSKDDDGIRTDYDIIEFNSVLALVSYYDWNFDIWDMNSFMVCGTWTKLVSITYQPSIEGGFVPLSVDNVLGVLRKDQLLILVLGDEQETGDQKVQVASYNLVNNQMKILPIDKNVAYYKGVGYKSSLVLIL